MFMFFQSQSNYQNSQQATQQSPQSSNHLSQQQVQPSFPISQHISQQHEQPNENYDVVEIQSQENENTPTSKKATTSKFQWSVDEDHALISAYLECGGYVLKGTDQNGDGFWGSVFERVEESRRLNPTLRPRTFKAITSRWKKINGDVNAWVGIYTEAKRKKGSGCNVEDVLTESREMWIEVHGPRFTLEHAWNVLKYYDKWTDGTQMSGGSSKRSAPDEGVSSKPPDGVKKVKSRRKAPISSSTSPSPSPSSSEFTRRIRVGDQRTYLSVKRSLMP
ncbi:uncharacterized protein LOC104893260 [Beta vulgaris subsp. vulgaris]|uniref:uncharacterized protein LOC104893260 n=1 Tax=Beta vulgaris subsp. vulgaris TaxID=3555 RepID=UPI0020375118|nr:uncharacterized protein LOC104893260 [Beta vulgaris subsp. vulgaris]